MTNTNLLQAMGHIDPALIADAAPDVPQKKSADRAWLKRASAVAACLVLVLCAFPIASLMFGNARSEAPASGTTSSSEETLNNDAFTSGASSLQESTCYDISLTYRTLYAKLNLDKADTCDFSVAYATFDSDSSEQTDPEKPLQLLIQASYPNGETTDTVKYYIIFNKDSVDDSKISGYEEQGLTKEINGVTVHYSLIQDGAMHGHAKFVYEGNLYVIDVLSWGLAYHLDTYVEMMLR